jgi:trimethylamine--corrinoid protein Co-methyltransferase
MPKMSDGFIRKLKPLQILTKEELEGIHEATLSVMETTGVTFDHIETLRLLADHGCRVDFKEKRARIPGWLAEDCLRQVPSRFTVNARDPKHTLHFSKNTLYFSNSMGMSLVDLNTWAPRKPTLQENHDALKVLDSLETVHYIAPYTPYMEIQDVPPAMVMLEGMALKLRTSAKVTASAYQLGSEAFAIRMAKVAGTDLIGSVSVSSPLTYSESACKVMYRWIEAGFPLCIGSGAIMGGSGPATIAGSTVTNNVEVLAGAILAQIIRPGTGVIVADFVHPMDMRRGLPAFGAVGCALHGAIFNQVCRRYGLLTSHWYAFGSSKKIDFQNGYERSMTALLSAMAGTNIVELHGAIYGELTWHPVQAVIDEDVAGWIRHFFAGVEISDGTLAVDLINKVGPIPGCYLSEDHTLEWWRGQQFIPKVADREAYPEWLDAEGKMDTIRLAEERVGEILAQYEPKPLTPEQDREIDTILEESRGYFREMGQI